MFGKFSEQTTSTKALIVGGTAAAAALIASKLYASSRRRRRLAGLSKIELLPSERGPLLMMAPATTTVDFFTGSPEKAAAMLQVRLASIASQNPWLNARLDYGDDGKVNAFYDADNMSADALFRIRRDIVLDRATATYDDVVKAVSPVACRPGQEVVGTAAPLFRATLIPDAGDPTGRFALVLSANHVLIEGTSFYRLYNMLSATAAVHALDPRRDQSIPAKMVEMFGGEPSPMQNMPGVFLFRFIAATIRNVFMKETAAFGFHVSAKWVAAEKAKAAAAAKAGEIPYVTTNDLVVSSVCNALDCDLAMSQLNFRGRIEGCTEDMVGNYEDLVSYFKPDYATPQMIRKSVAAAPFARAAEPKQPLPGNWGHLGMTYCVITNWSSFGPAGTRVVPVDMQEEGVKQELHMPIFDFNEACPPSILGSMVLFNPGGAAPGRGGGGRNPKVTPGVFVAGPKGFVEAIKASPMVGRPLELRGMRR